MYTCCYSDDKSSLNVMLFMAWNGFILIWHKSTRGVIKKARFITFSRNIFKEIPKSRVAKCKWNEGEHISCGIIYVYLWFRMLKAERIMADHVNQVRRSSSSTFVLHMTSAHSVYTTFIWCWSGGNEEVALIAAQAGHPKQALIMLNETISYK